MPVPITPGWLALRQATEYSSIGATELRALISAGRLPASKLSAAPNSTIRIRRADLDAFLEANRVTAGADDGAE